MTDMIERVARALLDADDEGAIHPTRATMLARAAIEAMREPTEKMIERGSVAAEDEDELSAETAWRAMIASILPVAP